MFDVGDPHAPQVAIIDCSPRFLKIVYRTIFTVLCTAASRPRFDGGKTGTARHNLNNNEIFPFYLVIQSLKVIVLPLGAITLRRGIPPRSFVNRFHLFFHDFLIFAAFCGSFSAIFAFSNKKLSTAHRLWITRFFILQAIPLAAFVCKKSAATAVTARKTQIPIVAKQPLCKRLVQRKHKKNLHFYRKHRFSRTKKDGKRFAIDFS